MQNSELLFSEYDLSNVFRNQIQTIAKEIEGFTGEYMIKVNVDDLTNHLAEKHRIEPIVLDMEGVCIGSHGETKIDKTHDRMYAGFGQQILVPGIFVEFVVPFTGDVNLFKCQPSSFNLNPPRASIHGNELRIRYEQVGHDQEDIKRRFKLVLESIEKNVQNIKAEVEAHNAKLLAEIRPRVEARKARLLKDQGLVEALGFPIRPKFGAQSTYAAPIQRKKLIFQAPKVSAEPFVPEPRLEMAEYDHILNTIANMALVFERSPIEFVKMGEETLRTHILVQLNAQYEGRATGETFNGEGKTDILIRENGKSIFIAECKFWKGGESFTATIDQLLNYTTWRDAKTAIVIFNRNKNTSAVIKQIPSLAKAHPQFRSVDSKPQPEGRFRFTFNQKNDSNRQILLTVMIFDVPV